jgi:3-deoxy-7-phosphoheptulonate synthase
MDAFFAICAAENVTPGGIHLEMSALDVTECLGGAGPASLGELDRNWQRPCDPRMNRMQTLELASRLASLLAETRMAA